VRIVYRYIISTFGECNALAMHVFRDIKSW